MLSITNDVGDHSHLASGADVDDEYDTSTLCLNYGHEAGSPEFLNELRSFLDRQTANDDTGEVVLDPTIHNGLFITHGVSHGIELICATQTEPGDVVWVERPTYFLVASIFRSHRLMVRGMPMIHPENNGGGGGIDVKRLIEMVESGKLSAPRMIYLVPTHQNPTGHTMPLQDRVLLSQFAQRHGVLLVADEVYHLLDWRNNESDGKRPARMAEFNRMRSISASSDNQRPGGILGVSSFTKIFAPGVRCGWIEAPEAIIQSIARHGYIQSQGGLAPFIGDLIMCRALQSRIADTFLKKLNAGYADRARKLCNILRKEERILLPNSCPTGGYFLWIKFPPEVDTEDFLSFCEQGDAADLEIRFRPGSKCDAFADYMAGEEQIANDIASGVSTSSFQSHARLCFADLDEDNLLEGGRRLVQAFRMYMDTV